jgi:hypothetical protein
MDMHNHGVVSYVNLVEQRYQSMEDRPLHVHNHREEKTKPEKKEIFERKSALYRCADIDA